MSKRSDHPRDANPSPDRMPRWVKVLVVVVGVLALIVVALQFVGGGQHGPNRHASADGLGAAAQTELLV